MYLVYVSEISFHCYRVTSAVEAFIVLWNCSESPILACLVVEIYASRLQCKYVRPLQLHKARVKLSLV